MTLQWQCLYMAMAFFKLSNVTLPSSHKPGHSQVSETLLPGRFWRKAFPKHVTSGSPGIPDLWFSCVHTPELPEEILSLN